MRTIILITASLFCGLTQAQTEQPIQIIKGTKADVELAVQEYQALNRVQFADTSLAWSSSRWYGGNFNAQLIDYLGNPKVRNQLEFTETQNKEFAELQKEYRKAYSDLYAEYPELKDKNLPQEARKVLNKKVILAGKKLREEFSEKLKESLIPRQVSMVKSLRFKQMAQVNGLSYALTNSPFKDELEVTDEQKKKITKIRADSEIAMQKKMAEMREEAKKEMLKVLSSKQRKMLKEIQGEKETEKDKK